MRSENWKTVYARRAPVMATVLIFMGGQCATRTDSIMSGGFSRVAARNFFRLRAHERPQFRGRKLLGPVAERQQPSRHPLERKSRQRKLRAPSRRASSTSVA